MRWTLILCLSICARTANAQSPLSIGDKVPDIVWDSTYNISEQQLSLAEYSDKLVLLDFWSTSCTSCLREFPRLDSIQQSMGDKVQIILLNEIMKEGRRHIKTCFDRLKNTGRFKGLCPVVYKDATTRNYFPHVSIPYFVWINKGKLLALTDAEAVTIQNINNAINGMNMDKLQLKEIDRNRPLYTLENLPKEQLLHFSILLKGEQRGIGGVKIKRLTGDIITGRLLTNFPLIELFKAACAKPFEVIDDRRVVLEVKDRSALLAPAADEDRTAWQKDHLYSYEIDLSPEQAPLLNSIMLNDLNMYSGYKAVMEKRTVDCYVLYPVASYKRENHFYKKPVDRISTVIEFLNSQSFLHAPILNQAHAAIVNADYPTHCEQIEDLRKWLWSIGLELREEKRELELLVIRDAAN